MKVIFDRIKQDIKNNWVGLTAVAVCLILLELFTQEVCPSMLVFGLPCPGCGLTRAGILLLKGDFAGAFQMHPFIYVFVLGLIYVGTNRYVRGKKEIPFGIPLLIFVILCMLVFFVYRVAVYFPDVEPLMVSEHTPYIDIRNLVLQLFQ